MKWQKLISLLAGTRRKSKDQQTALYLVAWHPARLLLTIAPTDINSTLVSTTGPQKIIGSTQQISEWGLIILVPTLQGGGWRIIDGQQFKIELELEPTQEAVEMRVVARGHEPQVVEGEGESQLVTMRIEVMSNNHRAHYLEFLGSHGW